MVESDPAFNYKLNDPLKPADAQKAAKVPVWQGVFAYFANALQAVGAISKFGCVKHNEGKMPTKWREYPLATYSDALARHITEEAKGVLYDPESRMLHAAHVAWNAFARLELLLAENPLNQPSNEDLGIEEYVEAPYREIERRTASGSRRVYYKTICINQRTGLGRRLLDKR